MTPGCLLYCAHKQKHKAARSFKYGVQALLGRRCLVVNKTTAAAERLVCASKNRTNIPLSCSTHPVACAPNVWLDNTHACLCCCNSLHKAAAVVVAVGVLCRNRERQQD